MRVLVAGCGYVGLALAKELVRQGHSVVGIRRSPEAAAVLTNAGVEPLITDLARPDFTRPEGRFDWVVYCASAGRDGGPDSYRSTYVDGSRNLLAHLATCPPQKFVYTGSTSVYAQTDGSLVKESSPTEPVAATGRTLLEAESTILESGKAHGVPSVILRIAGIYGPDRLYLLHQFIRNEVRLTGQGSRYLNMVHRDDVVGAILAALRSGRAGEVYNVVDQEPVTEIHFYTWLAETLGKYVPPFAPAGVIDGSSRGPANRKISNRRLTMELGCRLAHPTFRQGYTAEIKALTDAGLLEVPREER